jgi:hypothetical protein
VLTAIDAAVEQVSTAAADVMPRTPFDSWLGHRRGDEGRPTPGGVSGSPSFIERGGRDWCITPDGVRLLSRPFVPANRAPWWRRLVNRFTRKDQL